MSKLYPGIYLGIVTAADDPERRARLQVGVPALGIDASWAQPCVAYTGSRAAAKVPPAGTQVWIAFVGGRLDEPVWIGVLPRG
jgi:hypothetical protein